MEQTALEFGLPYYSNGSFVSAVTKHFKMLRDLGHMELQTIPNDHKTSNELYN